LSSVKLKVFAQDKNWVIIEKTKQEETVRTITNPKGGGRKARRVKAAQITLMLDEDLAQWLDDHKKMGRIKSDIANMALRYFKDKFDFSCKKPN
jgi:hypothetical protein